MDKNSLDRYVETKKREIEDHWQEVFSDLSRHVEFKTLIDCLCAKMQGTHSLDKDTEIDLLRLGEALHDLFEKTEKTAFFKQAFVSDYITRAVQQSAVMDQYFEEVIKAQNDERLTSEQRDDKIEMLYRLRDREIDGMLQQE